MKLLLMLFFLCVQTKAPGKEETAKKVTKTKKEAKAPFRLAPSVLIVHF